MGLKLPLSLFSILVSLIIPSAVHAAGITLSTNPETVSAGVGETFSVNLVMNTNGTSAAAAEIHLSFDSTKLQVQSLTKGTFMHELLQAGTFDNTTGTASIIVGRGSPADPNNSPVIGTGTLATITFKTLASGNSNINYTNQTQTSSIDGTGQNSLSSTSGASVVVGGSTSSGSSSLVTIFAAGQKGGESFPSMVLEVYDRSANAWKVVKTWTNVDGNFKIHPYPSNYTYNSPTKLTHEQVRVKFSNDFYGGSLTNDRNLYIDKVMIDGTSFESTAGSVYSTGTWSGNGGCTPGNKSSNILQCNGYFRF